MALKISSAKVDGCSELSFMGLSVLRTDCADMDERSKDLALAHSAICDLRDQGILGAFEVDHLIVVASLPRCIPEFLPYSVMETTGLKAGHAIEIGNSCAAILDALYLCASLSSPNSKSIILCSDSFSSSYDAGTTGTPWLDGSAALAFGESNFHIMIESYTVGVDSSFSSSSSFQNVVPRLNVQLNSDARFIANDLGNELEVVRRSVSDAGITWDDIDGYVTINRGVSRSTNLRAILEPLSIPLFESRADFGHRGGSDLINNLDLAFFAYRSVASFRLMLVGNGLGYSWSAMLISVRRT